MKAGALGSCGPRVGPERPARRAGQIVQRKLGSLRGGILSEWKGSPLALPKRTVLGGMASHAPHPSPRHCGSHIPRRFLRRLPAHSIAAPLPVPRAWLVLAGGCGRQGGSNVNRCKMNLVPAGRRGRRPLRRVCGRWDAVTPPYGGGMVRASGACRRSLSLPFGDSSCCGSQNSLLAERSQNFDRCHSLTSLPLPPAALDSLPLCTREPCPAGGGGRGRG